MYKTLLLSLLVLVSSSSTAYAYMDPGTGSMLLQGLIGALAAGMAYLSMYYKKIKEKILKLIRKSGINADKLDDSKEEK